MCTRIGSSGFFFRSQSSTRPSSIAAAKDVLLCGLQITSFTASARSVDWKVWIGASSGWPLMPGTGRVLQSFIVQSALQVRKAAGQNGLHRTLYTGAEWPSWLLRVYVSRYCSLYDVLHLWMRPSSVPTRYTEGSFAGKSMQKPLAWRKTMPSLCPYTELLPRFGFGTRLSCISGVCSRPFFMLHCSTRPSLLADAKKVRGTFSRPRSTQCRSHTTSVCLRSLCVELLGPDSSTGLAWGFRRSQMHTVPSWSPAAMRFGKTVLKFSAVTPDLVRSTRSGYVGFLSDQKSTRPSPWVCTGERSP